MRRRGMDFHLFHSKQRGLSLSDGNIVSAYIQVCNPTCLSDNSTRNGGIGYIICLVYLRSCSYRSLGIGGGSTSSFSILPSLKFSIFFNIFPFSFSPHLSCYLSSTRSTPILLGDTAKRYTYKRGRQQRHDRRKYRTVQTNRTIQKIHHCK